MADLSLKITANTAAASAAFKDLAENSDVLAGKIKKLGEDMGNDKADRFIQQQKLAGIAMQAVGKETEGLTKQHAAYEREIVKLINSGLGPESEAVQKLKIEYDRLGAEIDKSKNKKEAWGNTVKAAGAGLKALAAASAAAAVGIGAMVQSTANAGDEFYTTGKVVGLTAEQLQELKYAAEQSGVEYGKLTGSFQKLNKNVGDLKNGTGTLSTYLKANNTELLNQLQNVNNNDEAFTLLMGAIESAPNEFDRATLAQAAFGKSGQALIAMASEGTEGIAALREEAQKYGVITNESAAAGDAYNDTMAKLQQALGGARNAFAEKLLPMFTDFIDRAADAVVKVTDFIKGIDDLPGILEKVAWAVGAVGAALATLIIIDKISKAMAALNAIMIANPFGLIAAAVAGLIVALIAMYKNWDTISTYISQGVARLEYAFKWFASQIKEKFITAVNSVKIGFISLAEIVVTKVLGAVAKLLDVLGKIPGVGEGFKAAAAAVRGFSDGFRQATQEARNASQAAIQAAKDEQDAAQAGLNAKLSNIDAESRARRAAIDERKAQEEEESAAEEEKRLLAAENALVDDENAQLRRDAEIAAKQAQSDQELAIDAAHGEQETNIKNANSERVKKIMEEFAAFDKKLKDSELKNFSKYTSGYGELLDMAANKSTAAAVASKALATAEAAVNALLASSNALASVPYPLNFVAAGSALAAGLATQIKIWSTPIPSAETGGSFMVPNTGSVDSRLVRVNPGEQIDITPRGQSGGTGVFNFQFLMDSEVFAEVINKQAVAGNLYALQLSGNY